MIGQNIRIAVLTPFISFTSLRERRVHAKELINKNIGFHIQNHKYLYLSTVMSSYIILFLSSTFSEVFGLDFSASENLSSLGNYNFTIRNTTGSINISAVIDTRNLASNVSYSDPHNIPENIPYPELYEREKQEASKKILNKTGQSIYLPQEMIVNSSVEQHINEFNSTGIEENKSLLSPNALPAVLGFDSFDETNNECGGCVPPDINIAVGPENNVFVIVNKAGLIGKYPNCNPLCSLNIVFDFRTFFNLPSGSGHDVQDPRILYDALSERWFASASDLTTNSVLLAVSQSDNPAGKWTIYNSTFTNCADQPKIGSNNNIFIITADLVTNHCRGGNVTGVEYVLLDKNDLLASALSPRSISSTIGRSSTDYLSSLYPLQITATNSPLIITAVVRQFDAARTSFIEAFIFTGKMSDPGFTGVPILTSAPIQTVNFPPEATQPGTSLMLDTTDFRIEDAAYSQENIWIGLNDACTPENDVMSRSCIRLLELTVTSSGPNSFTVNVIKDFDVSTLGQNLFYPSLEITRNGTMGMVFAVSGPDVYPSLMLGAKFPNDPSNSLTEQRSLKTGSASYTNPSQGTALVCPDMICRYGDYFGTALDPENPAMIWIAGEYIKFRDRYSTHVAKIWPGR